MKNEFGEEKSLAQLQQDLLLAQSNLLKEIAKNMESNNLTLTPEFRKALSDLQTIDAHLQFASYKEAIKAKEDMDHEV